jgi:hypothetical protein
MHPDLQKLLDLQTKDLVLLAVDLRLRAVGDEHGALDDPLERAPGDVESVRRKLADAVQRREEMEKTIEAQRAQQEKRRARIEQVRTAREVQALMTEMDAARSVVARQESDWVKASEVAQQLETAVQEAEQRLSALESDQGGERARLEAAREAAATEREAASREREEAAGAVERGLRLRYDRLWAARTTTVVVPLRGDACGACFTAIPRNRRSQIRAGTHIEGCEACGVILYPEDGEG